jgi:hypothetical protein
VDSQWLAQAKQFVFRLDRFAMMHSGKSGSF